MSSVFQNFLFKRIAKAIPEKIGISVSVQRQRLRKCRHLIAKLQNQKEWVSCELLIRLFYSNELTKEKGGVNAESDVVSGETNHQKSVEGGFNHTTQTNPYSIKRLIEWRARPDYFKTSVENLVQEIFEQIDGVLSLNQYSPY